MQYLTEDLLLTDMESSSGMGYYPFCPHLAVSKLELAQSALQLGEIGQMLCSDNQTSYQTIERVCAPYNLTSLLPPAPFAATPPLPIHRIVPTEIIAAMPVIFGIIAYGGNECPRSVLDSALGVVHTLARTLPALRQRLNVAEAITRCPQEKMAGFELTVSKATLESEILRTYLQAVRWMSLRISLVLSGASNAGCDVTTICSEYIVAFVHLLEPLNCSCKPVLGALLALSSLSVSAAVDCTRRCMPVLLRIPRDTCYSWCDEVETLARQLWAESDGTSGALFHAAFMIAVAYTVRGQYVYQVTCILDVAAAVYVGAWNPTVGVHCLASTADCALRFARAAESPDDFIAVEFIVRSINGRYTPLMSGVKGTIEGVDDLAEHLRNTMHNMLAVPQLPAKCAEVVAQLYFTSSMAMGWVPSAGSCWRRVMHGLESLLREVSQGTVSHHFNAISAIFKAVITLFSKDSCFSHVMYAIISLVMDPLLRPSASAINTEIALLGIVEICKTSDLTTRLPIGCDIILTSLVSTACLPCNTLIVEEARKAALELARKLRCHQSLSSAKIPFFYSSISAVSDVASKEYISQVLMAVSSTENIVINNNTDAVVAAALPVITGAVQSSPLKPSSKPTYFHAESMNIQLMWQQS